MHTLPLTYALIFCPYLYAASPDTTEITGSSTPAEDTQETHWYTGYNQTLGAASKTIFFRVSQRGSNIVQGTLTDDGQTTPAIFVNSPFYYFTDPQKLSLGWFVEYGYSSFKVNKQAVGTCLDKVDMGTAVTGNYLYIAPVLFYNWSDAIIRNGRGVSFTFGPGLGYLQAKGNIVLTETTKKPRVSTSIVTAVSLPLFLIFVLIIC